METCSRNALRNVRAKRAVDLAAQGALDIKARMQRRSDVLPSKALLAASPAFASPASSLPPPASAFVTTTALTPLPPPLVRTASPAAAATAAAVAAPMPTPPASPLVFHKKSVANVQISALSTLNLGDPATAPPAAAAAAAATAVAERPADAGAPEALQEAASGFETAVSIPSLGQAKKPTPSDFTVLDEVGSGAFGVVLRVRHNASAQIMAMKIIEKRSVLLRGSGSKYVMSEKDLMRQVEHPFIVRLKCTLQSKTRLFLIMEYIAGGELFTHIRDEGLFSEKVAAFYAAEILLALEYLHSHKIVHRDLKPENVLLDEHGHIRITDFGLAAAIPDADGGGLKSIVGSPAYMAPEMLAGKPYGIAVDYWALGTLIFEMMTGDAPFGNKDSKKRLIQRIMNENPKFPAYLSASCVKLLRGLLDRNVERRLGAAKSSMFEVRGVAEVKASPFFASVDWDQLYDRELAAPFCPRAQSPMPLKVPLVNVQTAYGQSLHSPALDDKAMFDGFSYVAPGFL